LENLLQFIPTCNDSYFSDFSKYRNNKDSIDSLPSSTSFSSLLSSFNGMKNIDDNSDVSTEVRAESTEINDYISNLNLINISDVKWDDIFQTINCLYVFDNLLSLEMPIKLDIVIEKVLFLTLMGMKNDQDARAVSTENIDKSDVIRSALCVNSDVLDTYDSIDTVHTSTDTMIHENLICDKEVYAEVTELNVPSNDSVNDDVSTQARIENTDIQVNKENTELVLDIEVDDDNKKNEKMVANGGEMDIVSTEVRAVNTADHEEVVLGLVNEEKEVVKEGRKVVKEVEDESFNLPLLLESQADIDRIHLCLISALSGDLHTLLDMDEKESEIKKDKKSSAVKFPLNQVNVYVYE
jgi:hypothetical protein